MFFKDEETIQYPCSNRCSYIMPTLAALGGFSRLERKGGGKDQKGLREEKMGAGVN